MQVLFVTSEVARYAKTGGLADVSAALPKYLISAGHDVKVVMPFYSRVDTKGAELETVIPEHDITIGPHRYRIAVIKATRGSDAPVHLVDCPALYRRASLYTQDPDEHLRFLVLVRTALELCQLLRWSPDVIHGNDWQCGMLPLTLRVRYSWDRLLSNAKTLLTIHNLNYQGRFPASIVDSTGLGDARDLFHQDQLNAGLVNFLLHGILYADGVSTVSPTYAKEIQTPDHGAMLDPYLRARSSTVVGILNGVDYDDWSPERDALIPARFSASQLEGKAACKQALSARFRLPYDPRVPIVGIVSRLAGQKGFALLDDVLADLLRRHGFDLVVVGNGESRFERMFDGLARAFPRQVGFYNGFSNELAHLVEAGADMFLMPSRYEPCGLNQMYSLRYGTVPIVHKTGGLADTVQLWDPKDDTGTGFAFATFDAAGLRWAIEAALVTYKDPRQWRRLQQNGMAARYGWDVQGKVYETVYQRLGSRTAGG